jgi:hypothetical protein
MGTEQLPPKEADLGTHDDCSLGSVNRPSERDAGWPTLMPQLVPWGRFAVTTFGYCPLALMVLRAPKKSTGWTWVYVSMDVKGPLLDL